MKAANDLADVAFEGESTSVRSLLQQAVQAARGGDRPVLITGEVGAGKSQLAKFVHSQSARSRGPLLFLDCGGGPELDNLLFGHRAGSFTGAIRDFSGRLKQAEGGTLVLDDFERLSHHQQDQLHRVLVDGRYWPIGSDRDHRANVRFIATTNKHIPAEVEAAKLKRDFVSRLDYFQLHVPPLSDRPEDIPLLCMRLLDRNLQDLVDKGIRPPGAVRFHEDCWPAIQARRFSDNARGLDKLVVRLLAHIGSQTEITPAHINAVDPIAGAPNTLWFDKPSPLRMVRDEAERRYILEVCNLTKYNLRKAARILDISPKALYARLKQYGIARP